jgi:4-hydroxybenzoate polyprenyltransferase
MVLPALVEAMRPHQWVKNLLVFAPLVFAHRVGDAEAVASASLAFVVFCVLASAVYLGNDVRDADADRAHPKKRARPVASGRLGPGNAVAGAVVLALAGIGIGWDLGPATQDGLPFIAWPLLYVGLNTAYSLRLKQVAIVDALCIAMGFQFRVHAGSVAIGVPSSKWLLLCTFFFATFLAFCKRRQELAQTSEGATRAVLRDYSAGFLDQVIAPLAAMSILAYALYTVDDETVAKHGPNLVLTVPFVVFGVFRYLWLVHHGTDGEDPARTLLRDRQLVLSGVLWGSVVALVLGKLI